MNQEFDEKTQREIEAYITQTMSVDEKTSFEARMNGNTPLKQEVLLQQSVHQAFNAEDWPLDKNADANKIDQLTRQLNSDEYKKAAQNITAASEAYFDKPTLKVAHKKRFPVYKIAIAAAVLLLITIPFFLTNDSLESQYTAYANWQDIPSFVEKGEPTNDIIKGEELFRVEQYSEAIDLLTNENPPSPNTLMYLGISYLELDQTQKAIQVFDQLIATESIENSRGYWYKLLVYLKTDNEPKAKEMLNIILSSKDNYNYKKALVLSKNI